MKFEKFVKSLGGQGVIYTIPNGEKWLASQSVFMKIPETTTGILAENMVEMPDPIKNIIKYDMANEPCELYKAVMPFPGGAIKDCIRVYATENALRKVAIRNNDYSLIEKTDIPELHSRFNKETEDYESKALVIKRPSFISGEEPELVGVIFPAECDEC